MPRHGALLTTVLVTAFLVVPFHAAPATAEAAASCHGHGATIVGKPERLVTGTSGRDVIVTNGARTVRALGGDDLICVDRAPRNTLLIAAGAGDDATFVTDRHSRVTFDSGAGSDTYRSAGSSDHVNLLDDGSDDVSTGRRGDVVDVSSSSRPGTPRVQLGAGADNVDFLTGQSRGSFDGGSGDDWLALRDRSQRVWTIDNQRGEARAGHELRFAWHDFEAFLVIELKVPEVRFIGSAAAESIQAMLSRAVLRVTMGGGDDTVWAGRADDTIDGGSGIDVADGADGTDTCTAVEQAYDCEQSSRTR
jgi:Ca2+-binding RTX toxin-like protein